MIVLLFLRMMRDDELKLLIVVFSDKILVELGPNVLLDEEYVFGRGLVDVALFGQGVQPRDEIAKDFEGGLGAESALTEVLARRRKGLIAL